ncbi:1-phosphofructokinase [Vibrio sp. JCM 18905]|nr:1-phosphofructokinase [Vibrio sp. JCM 18905]
MTNKTSKVVTITLNPALDLTGSVNELNVGSVSLVQQSNLHAAGKGVNVAKVLSDLGADVTVTGFLGKDNPELFHQLFNDIGVKNEFVEVQGATRINVKLVEANGNVSDINFPGVQVTADEIARFEETLFRLAETHDYFVLAGSLPGGVTAEQCAAWIKALHQQGKKMLFDSSKAALKSGIEAHPWLIKPNDEELGDFVGEHLETPEQCQAAAQTLSDKGIENIVVSMGADGVMWLNQGEWLRAQPPSNECGKHRWRWRYASCWLVLGGSHATDAEKRFIALRYSTFCLAVSQVGVGLTSQEELENIKQQTEVSELYPITNLEQN